MQKIHALVAGALTTGAPCHGTNGTMVNPALLKLDPRGNSAGTAFLHVPAQLHRLLNFVQWTTSSDLMTLLLCRSETKLIFP